MQDVPRDLHCLAEMLTQKMLELLELKLELVVLLVVDRQLELGLQLLQEVVQEDFPKLLELHAEPQGVLHGSLHRPSLQLLPHQQTSSQSHSALARDVHHDVVV